MNLIQEGHLNVNVKLLQTPDSKLGKFRVLCKLHKLKFGLRPIVNNKLHPTSKLCKLIDSIIKPILCNTPSFLKDSQHLLQKCDKLVISNPTIYMYSMDFESLYTNLDKLSVCNILTEYIAPYLDSSFINSTAFRIMLLMIFENNIFVYNNNYFIQINGLAMGCICGPSVASLYVYVLEKHWLTINNPLFYGRFIDDICLISNQELDEDVFKKQFLNLNLNIIKDKNINFLDLVISFDVTTKKLEFSVYIKPTNTFSYLKTDSNHPNFIFANIPKSLFIRIRRICTHFCDYLFFTRKLIFQLLDRGYDFKSLIALQFTIGKIPRECLLEYKAKKINVYSKNNNHVLFFGNEFNRSFIQKNELYNNSLSHIQKAFQWLIDYKLKFYFLISLNLFSIFIHKKKLVYTNCHTRKCLINNCNICEFVNSNSYIFLKNGFIIPIKDNCNCISRNIIYIIRCTYCDVFYVGQTKRSAVERLHEHINDIKNFIPFVKFTSEVGLHFNLKNHNYKNNLQFYVFKKNLINLEDRLSVETDLIHLIKENNPPIINLKIPSKSNIRSLSFL